MDAASDDEAAFGAFVASSSGRLRRVAFLLTGDRELARDLLQTAYARAYAAWPRVRRDDAESYVRRILVNAHADHRRRRPWTETAKAEVPDSPVARASTEQAVSDRMVLVAALRRLSPRERAVVVLRYYADLTEAQTAATLGVGVGTVKKTANRALTRLRATPELADLTVGETSTGTTWLGPVFA